MWCKRFMYLFIVCAFTCCLAKDESNGDQEGGGVPVADHGAAPPEQVAPENMTGDEYKYYLSWQLIEILTGDDLANICGCGSCAVL